MLETPWEQMKWHKERSGAEQEPTSLSGFLTRTNKEISPAWLWQGSPWNMKEADLTGPGCANPGSKGELRIPQLGAFSLGFRQTPLP